MKKVLAAILCCSMILSAAVISNAALLGDWKDYKDEAPGYCFKLGDNAHSYEDILTVDEENKTFAPGKSYYFPAHWKNKDVTDEFFDYYDVTVNVTTAFPDYTSDEKKNEEMYLSSTEADKRVEKAEFVEINGKYYFEFKPKSGFSYVNEKRLRVVIIAKDKSDSAYRSWEEMDLDIGYTNNDKGGGVVDYITSSSCSVDNDAPIMEFAKDLGSCKIEMEEGSIYEAKFSSSKDTKINLYHTTDGNKALESANPGAKLRYLAFPAQPTFYGDGRLLLKADDLAYAYEIDENNNLTQVGAKNSNGYISIITQKLKSYVASSVPLKGAAVSGNIDNSAAGGTTESSSGSAATPPASQGGTTSVPYNPGTGAQI